MTQNINKINSFGLSGDYRACGKYIAKDKR